MIAVTGGDGFIGYNLIQRLKQTTDEKIISVDYTNNKKNTHWIHPMNFLFAKKYLEKTNIIFHNGASSDTTNDDPFDVMHKNFDYSVEVLKRCMYYEIGLIYASSASVYGDGPFSESSPNSPKNLYALSKSMFDEYSELFSEHLPQLTGLRYFNVYGRNEYHKGHMASVVQKFFHQIKKNNTISLFEGSDSYYRDFIHIDDVLDIIMHFYTNPKSGIYNVGTGVERNFLDIANVFQKRYGSKIKYIEMPEILKDRYQKYTSSDNTKINKVCNIKYTSLESGVNKYIDYLESQCE